MTAYEREIGSAALAHGLNVSLVRAVILVESGGNPWAWNPEPHYRYLWDVAKKQPFRALTDAERKSEVPPADFPAKAGDKDQEFWAQQASFGLMQVMGAVARERGFDGPYLTQLCDVQTNLTYGCRHLRALMEWAGGEASKALGAYNAGKGGYKSAAGLRYAAKVLRQLERR